MGLLDDLLDLGDQDINTTDRTTFEKAPFGWVGGKTESLKHIIPEIKKYLTTKWIEVFGGSGVVSLNVPDCSLMVYNDRYSGVVDFYRVLQNKELVTRLLDRLENLTPPHSREEWIHSRATWATESDQVERAAKWFYMVKRSVLGKCGAFARVTNSKGTTALDSALELFVPIHQKLKKFQIENLNWTTCLQDYDSVDAVFYLDPPYVGTDQGAYTNKFTTDDLQKLLYMVGSLKGTVLLSHYPNETIDTCPFWTEKLTWSAYVRGNVRAYTDENYKERHENQNYSAIECLWVKKHV